MKKIASLLFLVVLMTACISERLSKLITDDTQRYELDHLSVLPPKGNGWYGAVIGKSIDFSWGDIALQAEPKRHHIMIVPWVAVMDANDFEGELKKTTVIVNEYNARYEHLKNSPERPYQKVSVVQKAGMRCILREEISLAGPIMPKSHDADYVCEPPIQKKELPPIWIVYSEMVAEGVPILGPDRVMERIWNSIQFKPLDLEHSEAYKKWKIKNAESHVKREKMREREAIIQEVKRKKAAQQNP